MEHQQRRNTTSNLLGDPVAAFVSVLKNDFDFSLYPNPGEGKFNIKINSNKEYKNLKLEITDCTGRILFSNRITQKAISVNCNNFMNGIYFVRILNKDQIIGTAKYVLLK